MYDHSRRDSLVTILGLAILVLGFIFGIFLPEHRSNQQLQSQITIAKQDLINVPMRIAELDAMQKLLDKRQTFLKHSLSSLPAETDDQHVLNLLCQIADQAGVEVTGVHPQQSSTHKTYRCLAFQLEFQGGFRQIVAFLHGLENQQQLFRMDALKLTPELKKSGQTARAQLTVTTYAIRMDIEDSAENSDAPVPVTADTRQRVSLASQRASISPLAPHATAEWLDLPTRPISQEHTSR